MGQLEVLTYSAAMPWAVWMTFLTGLCNGQEVGGVLLASSLLSGRASLAHVLHSFWLLGSCPLLPLHLHPGGGHRPLIHTSYLDINLPLWLSTHVAICVPFYGWLSPCHIPPLLHLPQPGLCPGAGSSQACGLAQSSLFSLPTSLPRSPSLSHWKPTPITFLGPCTHNETKVWLLAPIWSPCCCSHLECDPTAGGFLHAPLT